MLGAAIVHGRTSSTSPISTTLLDRAGGAVEARDAEALAKSLGILLPIRSRGSGALAAAEQVVDRLGGGWRRRSPRSSPICCSCGWREGSSMREPAFWYRPPSWMSRLLAPLGALYGAVAARRMRRAGAVAGVPVVCVGNYHVGGAGKTPTVLALADILRWMGEQPVVVSRGYGGTVEGPVRVDPARHVAAEVGDEPLMMAAHRR